ncbi:MAG: Anthranilate phosphoribosyltransferase [Myxococcaceae bacterium]|nr:Anthranilate phosphoribosyltransferase [Myxococcaceae bacterium]
MTFAPILRALHERQTLSTAQTHEAFRAMMAGEVSHGEIGALLAFLSLRVPTADELLGAAQVMRDHVSRLPTRTAPEHIVDTCGTGGAPKTFNVSTLAGIVAAASGVKVAKHGNRSRTGRGSAELLEALGVNLEASLEVQAACLDQLGICFCFAVKHHPAMRNVAPVRQAMGFPTLFNLLGPLTNPAGAQRQVMGVYDARLLEPVAQVLRALGASRAIVVHSDDGLDEISISAGTSLVHVAQAGITHARVEPEELGLARASREQVAARDLPHAVQLARAILEGHERGAPRDAVLMTSAAALLVDEKVSDLAEGVRVARASIESGQAAATLQAWVALSRA